MSSIALKQNFYKSAIIICPAIILLVRIQKFRGKQQFFIFWSTSSHMSISVFAVSIALSKFLLSWKSRCSTSVVPLAATFSCGEFLKTDSGKLAYTYIWKEIAKQSTRSCDWTTLRTKMAQWSSIFHLKLDKNQNHNTWNIGLGDMLKFVLNQSNHTHTHTHPACNVSLIGLPCA